MEGEDSKKGSLSISEAHMHKADFEGGVDYGHLNLECNSCK